MLSWIGLGRSLGSSGLFKVIQKPTGAPQSLTRRSLIFKHASLTSLFMSRTLHTRPYSFPRARQYLPQPCKTSIHQRSSRLPTSRFFSSTPPRRSPSTSPPLLTTDVLFPLILALTMIPFTLFWYARYTSNLPLLSGLISTSLLTPTSSPWTLLTSGFFHTSPFHLAFNMFTLKTMLDVLAYTLSRPNLAPVLLATYIAGIVGGSLAMRNFGPWKEGAGRGRGGALGASGGVTALLVAASCVAPRMPMNIMFIPIDIPLAAVAALYLLIDAGYLNDATSRTGHAAHLGGGAVGAIAWALLLRR